MRLADWLRRDSCWIMNATYRPGSNKKNRQILTSLRVVEKVRLRLHKGFRIHHIQSFRIRKAFPLKMFRIRRYPDTFPLHDKSG